MKAPFLVELTGSAVRDLKRLETIEDEITDHLRELKVDPEKGHELTQNLQGVRSLEFSIKGSGEYRAAYVFQEEERTVTVFFIGTHENFYDQAARRMKLIKAQVQKARETGRRKAQKKTPPKPS